MLSVREMQANDIDLIANYWLQAEPSFLQNMGVDIAKLPSREAFTNMLLQQLNTPVEQKNSYCFIWEISGVASGHCNTNPMIYGEEAFMHLHLWNKEKRQQGIGVKLLSLTLPYFFENLKLKRLFSEPYALNIAPHKTLQKAGFEFVKEYQTIPGSLSFEQPVKRWQMSDEKYKQLYQSDKSFINLSN